MTGLVAKPCRSLTRLNMARIPKKADERKPKAKPKANTKLRRRVDEQERWVNPLVEDLLPLPPPAELRIRKKDLMFLHASWHAARDEVGGKEYHRLLLRSAEDWRDANEELVEKVNQGDDEALIELVKRDPRYLASSKLVAKVAGWKLDVIHGSRDNNIGRHRQEGKTDEAARESRANAKKRRIERATTARRCLDQLAAAIAHVTGVGNRVWIRVSSLHNEFEYCVRVLEEVKCRISKPNFDWEGLDEGAFHEFCKDADIDQKWIKQLIANPKRVRGLAEDMMMADYLLSRPNLRKLLRKATKLGQGSPAR
jgi:hypothetical protein